MRRTHKARALFGAVCVLLGGAGPAGAQAVRELTIMQPVIRGMSVWPIHVGEILGYFEEEAVALNLIASDPTVPYIVFLSSGQADVAMLDGAQAVHAANAGFDIANVYSVHQREPQGVYVKDSSPLFSAAELAGKTVGLASDRDHVALKIAMAHEKVTADGVNTIIVGESGPILASVFRDGVADAFVGSTVAVAALATQGIRTRDITAGPTGSPTSLVYTLLKGRIDELRPAMCGFLRAWSKGVYIGQQDIEIIAAMTRHPDGVPEEWESADFGYEYLYSVADLVIPRTERFGEVEVKTWQAIQSDMVLIGEIAEPRDVGDFLSNTYVDCANDFDRAEVMAEARAWMADPANAEYARTSK